MSNEQHPDAKIEVLRVAAYAAVKAHDDKDSEMKSAGANAKVRYPALTQLREAKNSAWSAYKQAADKYIKKELDKIIAADRRAGRKPAKGPGFVVDELHGKIRLT